MCIMESLDLGGLLCVAITLLEVITMITGPDDEFMALHSVMEMKHKL